MRRTIPLKSFFSLLASLECWLVIAIVGASMATEKLLLPAVVVGAGFWPIRWAATGRPTVRTIADAPILLLLLLMPMTLWVTTMPEVTQTQVFRLLTGIVLYYAIVNGISSRSRLRLFLVGTIVAGLVLAMAATVSVTWWSYRKLPFIPPEIYNHLKPTISDTINSNVMAGQLVMFFPLSLATLLTGWRGSSWPTLLLALLSTLAMGVMVLLTQSRGALMACVAELFLVLLFVFPRFRAVFASYTAALGLVLMPHYQAIIDFLTDPAAMGLQKRMEIWTRAWYMIRDLPLTGIGMGTFLPLIERFLPYELHSPGRGEHAHNIFLQVAVDLGVIGFVAWMAIYLSMLLLAWRVYRLGRLRWNHHAIAVGAGFFCSQIGIGVHGLLDAVIWGMVRPAPIVWGIWGLIVASHRILSRRA